MRAHQWVSSNTSKQPWVKLLHWCVSHRKAGCNEIHRYLLSLTSQAMRIPCPRTSQSQSFISVTERLPLDISIEDQHLDCVPKLFFLIWFCGIPSKSNKPWKQEEQTLTFLHADPPPLGDKRLSLWVSMWPQQGGVGGSETTYQDFAEGISLRTSESHLLRARASTTRQGLWLAWSKFDHSGI